MLPSIRIMAVIETPRLRIVPFSDECLTSRYLSWLNDAEVVKFSGLRLREHTLESCRAYWESFRDSPNYFWALLCRDVSLGHVGNVNAYLDTDNSIADMGILIGERSVWGQGYGSEAWLGVCDFLLRIAGVRKVTAGTIAPNKAMLGVMHRTGMAEDGRRIRQVVWNGQEIDVVHAAFFRESWLKRYPEGPFGRAKKTAGRDEQK